MNSSIFSFDVSTYFYFKIRLSKNKISKMLSRYVNTTRPLLYNSLYEKFHLNSVQQCMQCQSLAFAEQFMHRFQLTTFYIHRLLLLALISLFRKRILYTNSSLMATAPWFIIRLHGLIEMFIGFIYCYFFYYDR